MTDPASLGFNAAVTRGHVSASAGSLYSFTFSEFLEGLIFAALQCYPPPAAGASLAYPSWAAGAGAAEFANGSAAARACAPAAAAAATTATAANGTAPAQTASHVLAAVGKLLHERILPKAKHGDVCAAPHTAEWLPELSRAARAFASNAP